MADKRLQCLAFPVKSFVKPDDAVREASKKTTMYYADKVVPVPELDAPYVQLQECSHFPEQNKQGLQPVILADHSAQLAIASLISHSCSKQNLQRLKAATLPIPSLTTAHERAELPGACLLKHILRQGQRNGKQSKQLAKMEEPLMLQNDFIPSKASLHVEQGIVLKRLTGKPVPADQDWQDAKEQLGLQIKVMDWKPGALWERPAPNIHILNTPTRMPVLQNVNQWKTMPVAVFPPAVLPSREATALPRSMLLLLQLQPVDTCEALSSLAPLLNMAVHEWCASRYAAAVPPCGCTTPSNTHKLLLAGKGGEASRKVKVFMLEAPILPGLLTTPREVQAKLLLELLEACQPAAVPQLGPGMAEDTAFGSIIAQDMVLQDDFPCLPPVIVQGQKALEGNRGNQLERLLDLINQLRARGQSLAHLDLHLDWSLSDVNALGVSDIRKHGAEIERKLMPDLLRLDVSNAPASALSGISVLLAGMAAGGAATRVSRWAQRLPLHVKQILTGKKRRREENERPCGSQLLASSAVQPKPPKRSLPEQGTGVLRHMAPRANKRPKADPAEDMSFFVCLHRGQMAAQQGKATLPAAADAEPVAYDDDSESDSLSQHDEGDMSLQNEVVVELLAAHRRLFAALEEDHCQIQKILQAHSVHLTCAGLLEVSASEELMEHAKRLQEISPASKPDLLRAIAASALLRQTAIALVHIGIRCAHLTMHQSDDASPCSLLARSSWALKKAAAEVDRGHVGDHPKHAALTKLLKQITLLLPGGKILLLGDSRSFFAVYAILVGADMRAFQLDRDSRLLKKRSTAEDVTAYVTEAAKVANCILATYQQLLLDGFPLELFTCAIDFAPDAVPNSDARQSASKLLAGAAKLHRVALTVSRQQQEEPANKLCTDQQQASEQQWYAQAEGIVMSADGTADPHDAAGMRTACSWAVVTNSSKDSYVHHDRSLYEAILQMERDGATVLERDLRNVDLALSTSTCLCIWTEQSLQRAAPAPLLTEWLRANLLGISCAYTLCIAVFEGSNAFQEQAQDALHGFQMLAHRVGICLQCFISASQAATQDIVATAIRSYARLDGCAVDSAVDSSAAAEPMCMPSEQPSPLQAFLEQFAAWNPFTAAAVAASGHSLQQLLCATEGDLLCLAQNLPGVTERSAKLFYLQLTAGTPVWVLIGEEPDASGSAQSERDHSTISDDEVYQPQNHNHPHPLQSVPADQIDLVAVEDSLTWDGHGSQQVNPRLLQQHLQPSFTQAAQRIPHPHHTESDPPPEHRSMAYQPEARHSPLAAFGSTDVWYDDEPPADQRTAFRNLPNSRATRHSEHPPHHWPCKKGRDDYASLPFHRVQEAPVPISAHPKGPQYQRQHRQGFQHCNSRLQMATQAQQHQAAMCQHGLARDAESFDFPEHGATYWPTEWQSAGQTVRSPIRTQAWKARELPASLSQHHQSGQRICVQDAGTAPTAANLYGYSARQPSMQEMLERPTNPLHCCNADDHLPGPFVGKTDSHAALDSDGWTAGPNSHRWVDADGYNNLQRQPSGRLKRGCAVEPQRRFAQHELGYRPARGSTAPLRYPSRRLEAEWGDPAQAHESIALGKAQHWPVDGAIEDNAATPGSWKLTHLASPEDEAWRERDQTGQLRRWDSSSWSTPIKHRETACARGHIRPVSKQACLLNLQAEQSLATWDAAPGCPDVQCGSDAFGSASDEFDQQRMGQHQYLMPPGAHDADLNQPSHRNGVAAAGRIDAKHVLDRWIARKEKNQAVRQPAKMHARSDALKRKQQMRAALETKQQWKRRHA